MKRVFKHLLIVMVMIAACLPAFAVPTFFLDNFNSAPTLSPVQAPNSWYPERFAPNAFEQVVFDGQNRLHQAISIDDAAPNRPSAYVTSFYNTQGRKYDLGNAAGTWITADLYIPSDWETSHRRADVWATGFDATNTVSAYPIIGFANTTGSNPTFRTYNSNDGSWTNIGMTITYGQWYTLKMKLTGTQIDYYINGNLVSSFTPDAPVTTTLGNMMLQAYNFGDPTLAPEMYDLESYDVYWDNVGALSPIHNLTKDTYHATIQLAVDNADNGNHIEVGDGTYTENVSIAGKNLKLTSVNGRAATTIQGIQNAGKNACVSITGPTNGLQIGDIDHGFTIIGFDGPSGIENAGLYFIGGGHTNNSVIGNDIRANGDEALLCDYNADNTYLTIDHNIISGKSFVGTNPGIGDQWTVPNVPRQLVVIGGGPTGTNTHHITFTNNTITGTAGGFTVTPVVESGNSLVTIDADNSTITGNTFAGITTKWSNSLRCRRASTTISGNTFSSTGLTASCWHLLLTGQTVTPTILSSNTFDKRVYVLGGPAVGFVIQTVIDDLPAVNPPGTTILVGNGTFTEAISITKSFILSGEVSKSLTYIKAPATMPIASDIGSNIVTVSGTGVSFEICNVTILGPGPSGCGSIGRGIFVKDNAYAYIHDNNIIDIRDEPFSGCQNGVAIQVGRQALGTSATAKIELNAIARYQKNGITVDNAGSYAEIYGNNIQGAGTTNVIAQNGIQISRGAKANLTGNFVANNSYHNSTNPSDWGSTGILLYQSSDVNLVYANEITGNDQNLYVYDVAGAVTLGANKFGPSPAPQGMGTYISDYSNTPVDATLCTFNGVLASTATEAELFEIEDWIYHRVDDIVKTGFVRVKPANVYVTPNSFSPTTTTTPSIQRGIDAASDGDVVNVQAGNYGREIATNRTVWGTGMYQFGLFIDKNNITVKGYTSANVPAANASEASVLFNTGATNNFGASGIFVQADGVKLEGLKIGDNFNNAGARDNNKTIEIIGNGFNMQNCWVSTVSDEGAVYFGEFNPSHPILAYSLTNNIFDNTVVSINNGTGTTGDVANRIISDNEFTGAATPYLIGFRGWNGPSPAQGWIVLPCGGAVITGNAFNNTTLVSYVVARGNAGGILNGQIDWNQIWNSNTFGNHVVTLSDEPTFAVRSYNDGSYPESRRISLAINENIAIAQPGDVVLVSEGTFNENVVIAMPLTLKGANAGFGAIGSRQTESIINASSMSINAAGAIVDGFTFLDKGTLEGAINIVGGSSNISILNSIFTRTLQESGLADGSRGVINEFGGMTGLNVTNCKFTGWHTGVYVQNASAILSGNMFDANFVGTSNDGPIDVDIHNNIYQNNAFEAIGVGPGSLPTSKTIKINQNSFRNNGFDSQSFTIHNYINEMGVYPPATSPIIDPTFVVDASNNWWDSANGPLEGYAPTPCGWLDVLGITTDGKNNHDNPFGKQVVGSILFPNDPALRSVNGPNVEYKPWLLDDPNPITIASGEGLVLWFDPSATSAEPVINPADGAKLHNWKNQGMVEVCDYASAPDTWKDPKYAIDGFGTDVLGNKRPGVNFIESLKYGESSIMTFPVHKYVTTDITNLLAGTNSANLKPTTKNLFVAFRPTEIENSLPQVIFEAGGGVSGFNVYIQNQYLVMGIWNRFESYFFQMSTPLENGTTYIAHMELQLVPALLNNMGEVIEPATHRVRMILNGTASAWFECKGLQFDNSPSGIGAEVAGTRFRNSGVFNDYARYFTGYIGDIKLYGGTMYDDAILAEYDYYNTKYGTPAMTTIPAKNSAWEFFDESEKNSIPAGKTTNIFPNPFSNTATLALNITESQNVRIELFDMTGVKMLNVYEGNASMGLNSFTINGAGLPTGVYTLKITGNNFTSIEKVVLSK